MKKEYTKYYCDLCKKEVLDENSLKTIIIPIAHLALTGYTSNRLYKPYLKQFDVCDECLKGISKAISKEFADIYTQDYVNYTTVEFVEKEPLQEEVVNEK